MKKLTLASVALAASAIAGFVAWPDSDESVPVRAASLASDERRLTVEFVNGIDDCQGTSHLAWEESASEVRVTVTISKGQAEGTTVCMAVGKIEQSTHRLTSPLGERPLIDGSTGATIPVRRGS